MASRSLNSSTNSKLFEQIRSRTCGSCFSCKTKTTLKRRWFLLMAEREGFFSNFSKHFGKDLCYALKNSSVTAQKQHTVLFLSLLRIPRLNSPISKNHPQKKVVFTYGGERGIRTLDGVLAHTRFPVVRLRPAQPSLQRWIVRVLFPRNRLDKRFLGINNLL